MRESHPPTRRRMKWGTIGLAGRDHKTTRSGRAAMAAPSANLSPSGVGFSSPNFEWLTRLLSQPLREVRFELGRKRLLKSTVELIVRHRLGYGVE